MSPHLNDLTILSKTGSELSPHIPELADLRIEIFRDYPYLYDGNTDYEKKYLNTYIQCPQSFCALVFHGEKLVGATTGIPLIYETPEVKAPFLKSGYDLNEVFYFGESILKKAYRGLGLGIRFFHLREQFAKSISGVRYTAFCGVQRPSTHRRKPENYKPLDLFWKRMGYEKQENMTTSFSWKDLDETTESPKEMQFWLKMIQS